MKAKKYGAQVIAITPMYRAAMVNTIWTEKKISIKKKWLVFLFNVFEITFRKYEADNYSSVHIVGGKAELRTRNFLGTEDLYYGLTFNSFGEFHNQKSHISFIKRWDRLLVFSKAVFSYHMVKREGGCLAYWLDFCLWNEYLMTQRPETLVSNGHYDRLTTALSELCRLYSIDFQMKQHGLLTEQYIPPHKIYCNKVYAYDETQADIFRRIIVSNIECDYEMWYDSGIRFTNKEFPRYSIGIIECRSDVILEIYDILANVDKYGETGTDVYVMLHPLNNEEDYAELVRGCKANVVFTRDKYMDYDVIVATPSTLTYDYIRAGYDKKIILADFGNRLQGTFDAYHNVLYVDTTAKLEKEMIEVLSI